MYDKRKRHVSIKPNVGHPSALLTGQCLSTLHRKQISSLYRSIARIAICDGFFQEHPRSDVCMLRCMSSSHPPVATLQFPTRRRKHVPHSPCLCSPLFLVLQGHLGSCFPSLWPQPAYVVTSQHIAVACWAGPRQRQRQSNSIQSAYTSPVMSV